MKKGRKLLKLQKLRLKKERDQSNSNRLVRAAVLSLSNRSVKLVVVRQRLRRGKKRDYRRSRRDRLKRKLIWRDQSLRRPGRMLK